MAASSVRYLAVLVPLGTVYLSQALGTYKKDADFLSDMKKPAFRAVGIAAVAIAFAFMAARAWSPLKPVNPLVYSEGAVAFINKHYPNKHFLNHYNLGGMMLWLGRGQPRVFVDSRAGTAYPEEVLKDYLDYSLHCGLDPRGREIERKYAIFGVVQPVGKEYAKENACWNANTRYRVAYRDEAVMVYIAK
jgi:hypothetical protein